MKSRKKNSKLPKCSILLIILGFLINLIPVILFAIFFIITINNEPIHKDLIIEQEPIISYDEEKNVYTITGFIQNTSHTDYYYVDVVYKLYDENGNEIVTINDGYLDIGLNDTMKDLLVNFLGAIVFSCLGYFYIISNGSNKFITHFIPHKGPRKYLKIDKEQTK